MKSAKDQDFVGEKAVQFTEEEIEKLCAPRVWEERDTFDRKGTIVLDFHNVVDSDPKAFITQASKWNEQGYAVHVCSYVGRGSRLHASLLAFFDQRAVRKVFCSLVSVFNKKSRDVGKGNVVKRLRRLSDKERWIMGGDLVEAATEQSSSADGVRKKIYYPPCIMVDDGLANLQNVYDCERQCGLVHYLAVPETQRHHTPRGVFQRAESLNDLVCSVNNLSRPHESKRRRK